MRFIGYAGDCVIEAVIDLPEDGRLTDRLNHSATVTLSKVRLQALDDGRVVEVGDLELDLHDIYAVEAPAHGKPAEQRIATRSAPVQVEAGPYRMVGQLHGPTTADALLSIGRRNRMIPLTHATLVFNFAGRTMTLDRPVVIFNRDRAESVRRVVYQRTKLDELGHSPVDPRTNGMTPEPSLGLE